MLEASDLLAVLGQLDRAGVVIWLDGGWGVDALLGRQSRPHQDLDLVIDRDDLALLAERFGVAVPAAVRRSGP